MKKVFSGMFLIAGLSVLILGGCYEKPAEAPKAEAPKAAPAEAAPTSAPAAAAPSTAPAAAK